MWIFSVSSLEKKQNKEEKKKKKHVRPRKISWMFNSSNRVQTVSY